MPAVSSSSHGDLDRVVLDGSRGEGGGQILRTALTLSLLTGRPFRMVKIRANRDKPGLRPQHQKAVEAAAALGEAKVTGWRSARASSRFRPATYAPRDLSIDIGTAGSTGLGAADASFSHWRCKAERPDTAGAHRRDIQPQGAGLSVPRRDMARLPGGLRHAADVDDVGGRVLSARRRPAGSLDRTGDPDGVRPDRPRALAHG